MNCITVIQQQKYQIFFSTFIMEMFIQIFIFLDMNAMEWIQMLLISGWCICVYVAYGCMHQIIPIYVHECERIQQ